MLRLSGLTACAFISALLTGLPAYADDVLTVYASRKEEMLKPQLDAFTKQTGIKTQMIYGKAPKLLARLESEGKDSPADVLMPADVASMQLAANKGLLKAVNSATLNKNIPAQWRDPAGHWFGLGKRARVIIYNKEKLTPAQLSTYEALTEHNFDGQVLVRSSSHPYNLSLIAAMIDASGKKAAQKWADGIAVNLTRSPQGGDRDQIKAVAAGEGSVAIANSYYYARMLNSEVPDEKEAAKKTSIFFPNQRPLAGQLKGTHVNVSGAGVVATTDMEKEAIQLIEYLSGAEAQRVYADSNQEYPVNPAVKPSATLQSFGDFKADTTPLAKMAEHMAEAIRITDRSGWQ